MQVDWHDNEEESFVAHIRANPSDELPRLIYADYLEDRGDPRGELIRIQCELSHLPPGDPGQADLAARETELLAAHAAAWLAPLRELGAQGISARCFRRGLIERVKMSAATFVARAERLCAVAPALSCVELRDVGDAVEALSHLELPAQIRGLDLNHNRLGPGEIRRLKTARWIEQLHELQLSFNELADEGAAELASVPWPQLRSLWLGRNRVGPEGVGALTAAAMPALVSLSLALNPVGPQGAELLASSSQLARLEELDLAAAGILSQGALALARSDTLRSLKRLNLRANQITADACQELARARHGDLTYLDLRLNAGTVGLMVAKRDP